MFVSGSNINLQLCKESCDKASNDSHGKYTAQVYHLGLDKKSNAACTGQTSKLCLKVCSAFLQISVLHPGLLGSYAHMTW